MVDQPITIEPHPTYGYPSVLAYKLLQAIMKKLTEYGYPAPEYVSFSKRELAELCGHASFGGWQSQNLFRAAMQLNSTKVWCSFSTRTTRTGRSLRSTSWIPACSPAGGQNPAVCVPPASSHHQVAQQSLQFLPQLRPDGRSGTDRRGAVQAAVFHFSNLYSKKQSSDLIFTKDYAAICRTWLGDIKPERYKSLIVSNQLGRHLQALRQCGLIRSWEIRKNADKTGFNLSFSPGNGFFEDYHQFYAPHQQPPMLVRKTQDERTIQRPMELVAYFYRRLYQTDSVDEVIFPTRKPHSRRRYWRTTPSKTCKPGWILPWPKPERQDSTSEASGHPAVRGSVRVAAHPGAAAPRTGNGASQRAAGTPASGTLSAILSVGIAAPPPSVGHRGAGSP